jgi:hypothetical protein
MSGSSDAEWHVQFDEEDSSPSLTFGEGYDASPVTPLAESYDASSL